MFGSWTFGRKVASAFGLAALVLLAVAAIAYQNTNNLIDANRWVAHTLKVRAEFSNILLDMTQAESASRGFVITGDPDYQTEFQAAASRVDGAFADAKTLTSDNATQQARLAELGPLIDQKLAVVKRNMDARTNQGADAALQLVNGGEGKKIMDQVRTILTAADDEEAGLQVQRDAASASGSALAVSMMLWGGLAGVIIVGLIGWFMTRSLNSQIGGAVGHVQSSSAELQSAANQQASGMKEQTISMNEIATTISELLATSRQIAESAQRVAKIAEETTGAARSGDGTVERATESITSIRRQVDQIVGHMLELGKKSQQIGAVLDIVSELAEQTNILSINATIEAAGAGETGKRFAIVADEIRKLADRVAGAAKEVRGLIDDVRSSVNTTVMATETGSKAVDAGSRQFTDVAAAFKAIANLVGTTTEAAREIELSTKQQTTAVEQVNMAIANVTQAARETEASTSQTLETASLLAATSSDLLKLVQKKAA
ncbi:MAG TPA: methyl-accepting chemotaxis protein [Bauldia sp.]|nr:methyl-accepting chemotaxis protein [Bauldia sp.]